MIAVYDLEVGPVSFDFVVWLIKAKLAAKGEPLHVVIVPYVDGVRGMFRDKTAFYSGQEMEWRLHNILIPAAKYVGASVSFVQDWPMAERICKGEKVWPVDWANQTLRNRHHLIGGVIEAAKRGENIPMLRAPDRALEAIAKLFPRPYATMTVRETYDIGRNSKVTDWQAARTLIAVNSGMPVILVRDVSYALEHGFGFAELNLDLRMALYQLAAINLQSNNGTASLCWFSEAPYRMFDAGIGESRKEWGGLFVEQGLPFGETWPWARREQKIIYEQATTNVILREFASWGGVTK